MGTVWDERFAGEEYYYGTEPNEFVRKQSADLPKGKALCLGEGEGRNAAWLASHGFEVVAVALSTVGLRKAQALANRFNASISTVVADLEEYVPAKGGYDLVVITFVHLPPEVRTKVHRRALAALKPEGYLILQCFSKDQLQFQSGGPKDSALLVTTDDIRFDFLDGHILLLEQSEEDISEGAHHIGHCSVVSCLVQAGGDS